MLKHLIQYPFVFIIFLPFLSHCGNKRSITYDQTTEDTVTLVFHNVPDQEKFIDKYGLNRTFYNFSFISYITPEGFPEFKLRKDIPDTLKLPTIDGYLEISHLYNGRQYNYFYLKGGDVVTFEYDSLKHPIAISAISPELTYMYNWENNLEGSSLEYGLKPSTLYWLRKPVPDPDLFHNYHTPYIENFESQLEKSSNSQDLDSVYIYYYKHRLQQAKRNHQFFDEALEKNILSVNSKYHTTLELDDSLTKYISYYEDLQVFYNLKYDDVLTMEMPENCRKLIFLSIFRNWYYPGAYMKSEDFIEENIRKYYAATGDSTVIERVREEFKIMDRNLNEIKFGDMTLLDKDRKNTTLEEVLGRLKGKVLYVDLWASWCGPCIANLPRSIELAKEYNNKDVAFIYLGYNDDFDKWKDAMKAHGIDGHGASNYFIVDAEKTDLVNKLAIRTIPRYIIFDKTGKIVEPDAPRPGSSEIRGILDKYL